MRAGAAALIVVVARRAGGQERGHHGVRSQLLHPRVLGLPADVDLIKAVVAHVRGDRRDRLRCVGLVVRNVRDEIAAMAELNEEHVREAAYVDAVQGAHSRGPELRQPDAVLPSEVETVPSRGRRADLEARGVDDAVDRVLGTGRYDTALTDPLDALAVGVDETDRRQVESVEVLVVEARALAELAVPRLELLCGAGVLDDRVDPGTDLAHLLEVRVLEVGQQVTEARRRRTRRGEPAADALGQVGPTVVYEILA